MITSPKYGAMLSLSDIAELTDKSLPVVSNWRRRSDDFPKPVGRATHGGDLFDSQMVISWLRANGKTIHGTPESQLSALSWNFAAGLRGKMDVTDIKLLLLEAAALAALDEDGPTAPISERVKRVTQRWPGRVPPDAFAKLARTSGETAEQVEQIVDYLSSFSSETIIDAFDDIIARGTTGEYWTPPPVVSLMAQLCPSNATSFYDPACGTGALLAAGLHQSKQFSKVGIGQDINRASLDVARLRFALLDQAVELYEADTLLVDHFSDRLADVVLCDPPFGLKPASPSSSMDSRWQFGRTPMADLLWIQHAVAHLQPQGLALVTSAMGPLFRGGVDKDTRMELVRRGAVEAIIALPARMYPQTGIHAALWLLRRPEDNLNNPDVLFIDASDLGTQSGRKRVELPRKAIERILSILNQWRNTRIVSEAEKGVAVSVPRFDVLSADANLLPTRWIGNIKSPEDVRQFQDLVLKKQQQAAIALQSLTQAPSVPLLIMRDITERSAVSLDRLVAEGDLEVIRSIRTKELKESKNGLPIVTVRDVRMGLVDPPDGGSFVKLTDDVTQTKKGDVLVVPKVEGQLATLVEETSRVPDHGVLVLRIVGDWIAPEALSQILAWDVSSMSNALTMVKVKDVSIPLLSHSERAQLSDFFTSLTLHARLTQQYQAAMQSLAELVRTALPWTSSLRLRESQERVAK